MALTGGPGAADILERLRRPALWLVVLVFAATILFYLLDIKASFEPRYLNLSLYIIFVILPSFLMVSITTRGFLRTGSWPVVWLGTGTFTFALGTLLGSWLVATSTANIAVTASNIIYLTAGTFHLIGGFFVLNRVSPQDNTQGRMGTVLQVYLPVLAFIAFVTIVSTRGLLPPFFAQGTGGTPLRQMVVGTAAMFFLLSGLMIFSRYLKTKSGLLYWYSLGLLLFSLGMLGILIPTTLGTPLNWMGRGAQLLGGLYLLAAVLVTLKEAKARQVSAWEAMAGFFRSPADYRLLVETANDAINATTLAPGNNFIIQAWNKASERIYGWRAEEVIGRTANDVFQTRYTSPGITRDKFIAELLSRGYWTGEAEQKRKNGSYVTVRRSVSLLRDERGQPTGAVSVSSDITVLKKAEEALRQAHDELELRVQERTREMEEANRRLKTEVMERQKAEEAVKAERQRFIEVLDMLPAYVVLLDKDYHVPFANKFFRERFGESHGKRCFEYLFNRSEACENCESYKVMKTKAPYHWEWLGPDGRNYDIHDFLFTDIDGSQLIMEMGIDITERKKAEAELQQAHDNLEIRVRERTGELAEARDYLNNLIDYANAPIIVWDPSFRVTRFNHAFERLTGRSAVGVLGQGLDILFPEDSREASLSRIREAAAGEHWEVVEIPILNTDGTVRTVLWNSANIMAPDGQTVVATIAQGQDITERKQMEEQIAAQERLAYLGKLAGTVSHEIRNPLAVIDSSAFFLEKTLKDAGEKTEAHLQRIRVAVNRATAITQKLLEHARMRPPNLERVELTAFLREMAGQGIPGGIRVELKLPEDGLATMADEEQLKIVFSNIIRNAREAMGQKGILTVAARRRDGQVEISVADTGPGIPPENMDKLFQPLFTTKEGGVGFGLAIARAIVERHGGTLAARSQPEQGATFTILLPLAD